MQDQRTLDAIGRIERAVARLEQAAARDPQAAAAAEELARLRAAHDQLRQRVRGAIGEIDRLLAARGEVQG